MNDSYIDFPEDKIFIIPWGEMSAGGIGLYLQLVSHFWEDGSLPTEPDDLRKLANCSREDFNKYWPEVSPRFTLINKRLTHKHMGEIRAYAIEHNNQILPEYFPIQTLYGVK